MLKSIIIAIIVAIIAIIAIMMCKTTSKCSINAWTGIGAGVKTLKRYSRKMKCDKNSNNDSSRAI